MRQKCLILIITTEKDFLNEVIDSEKDGIIFCVLKEIAYTTELWYLSLQIVKIISLGSTAHLHWYVAWVVSE